jgi:hypothetical protein
MPFLLLSTPFLTIPISPFSLGLYQTPAPMQRIATLLDKIKELNDKPDPSIIEVDLMMDYTKVLYADLLELRNKKAFTEPLTLNTDLGAADIAEAMKENHAPLEETPTITAPSIELDTTSLNYKSSRPDTSPSGISFTQSHYSDTDIRQHIGINDKYQYISELFRNNKEAYEEVITEINSFDSLEEALSWLGQSVATQHNWNEEDESVQSFYRLLQLFFKSR